jgi:L-seryl-tRNA(Ser) seleniumtransferase
MLALLKPGDTVVGFAPPPTGLNHPTVVRAVASVGGTMVNSMTSAEFQAALDSAPGAKLVTILRLRAESELIPLAELEQVIRLAKERGLPVYLDDAAGARLCPVAYGQPKPLELGVNLAGTGMDKTGLRGPRFGILGGRKDLVEQVKAKAFDHGLEGRPAFLPGVVRSLEAYSPAKLRLLVETTRALGEEMRRVFGERVERSPATIMLRDEEILSIALERSKVKQPAIVPLEASATLSLILLEEHGIVTVHATTGWPSFGGLLLKDVQLETLERFGGAKAFVSALDSAFDRLARIIGDPGEVRRILFGSPS